MRQVLGFEFRTEELPEGLGIAGKLRPPARARVCVWRGARQAGSGMSTCGTQFACLTLELQLVGCMPASAAAILLEVLLLGLPN